MLWEGDHITAGWGEQSTASLTYHPLVYIAATTRCPLVHITRLSEFELGNEKLLWCKLRCSIPQPLYSSIFIHGGWLLYCSLVHCTWTRCSAASHTLVPTNGQQLASVTDLEPITDNVVPEIGANELLGLLKAWLPFSGTSFWCQCQAQHGNYFLGRVSRALACSDVTILLVTVCQRMDLVVCSMVCVRLG